ncbi:MULTISPECIES: hypothetical protein [Rhizobium]|uniref:hypothetical protein n=1 Tax=Rhizobium TaxID=379 RepID=UPI001C828A65|nr:MULTISPECIES: hypothetical protein [Rhizobium]MBX4952108.1 hypothetical protein [Rhizobium binae]MBX5238209.1 hypothetical protein [Rhizobium sp. NLR22b]MBX5276131.1 hypothetical protein [Rhizobium sp. NLR13a]MBX5305374.1 hypothetical protein [Rhizobium sp. NLR14b]
MRLFAFALAILSLTATMFFPEIKMAKACGRCEYKDSFGICMPYDKCVIPQIIQSTPVVVGIKVAQALATGDEKKIRESIGSAVINSGCPLCISVAHTVLPNLSDQQINSIAGEGVLVWMATGDPVVVAIDVGTNIANAQTVKGPEQDPGAAQAQPVPGRHPPTYTATAECLSRNDLARYVAGWKGPPEFIDEAGNKSTFPNVDLRPGDTVVVTAPPCQKWEGSIAKAAINFETTTYIAGKPEQIKFFIYGH